MAVSPDGGQGGGQWEGGGATPWFSERLASSSYDDASSSDEAASWEGLADGMADGWLDAAFGGSKSAVNVLV
jgi:hypothetical protein